MAVGDLFNTLGTACMVAQTGTVDFLPRAVGGKGFMIDSAPSPSVPTVDTILTLLVGVGATSSSSSSSTSAVCSILWAIDSSTDSTDASSARAAAAAGISILFSNAAAVLCVLGCKNAVIFRVLIGVVDRLIAVVVEVVVAVGSEGSKLRTGRVCTGLKHLIDRFATAEGAVGVAGWDIAAAITGGGGGGCAERGETTAPELCGGGGGGLCPAARCVSALVLSSLACCITEPALRTFCPAT